MIQEAFIFYKPCKLLQPYVRYYWVFSSNQMPNTYTFPIGCPQIIFHKRTPLYIPELGTTQSKLTISGQVNFSSHLQADDDIEMIVVVFHPHTINMFLNAPAYSFYNQEISGYDIEDEQLNKLAAHVFECEDNSLCVTLIENWLLDRLSIRSYDTIYRVKRMNAAIEQLFTAPQTMVADLSSALICSVYIFSQALKYSGYFFFALFFHKAKIGLRIVNPIFLKKEPSRILSISL